MSSFLKVTIVLFVTMLIFETETIDRHVYQGAGFPPRRDFESSKWLSNRAMDVWYGNRTMIEVLSSEFSNMLMKLTGRGGGRPGRSALEYSNLTSSVNGTTTPQNESDIMFSRSDLNSMIENNKTTRLIHILPMKNNTVFKLLTPILEVPEH
ncbi:uncharacterized protein LOC111358639 [Spodoptera litura]|uniref:Uncharacterized protein LOC111358639 n=1 Tax=Spodoptera litura TaxID=69820 RepID=A0A9J7IWG8_SPOLT|nr:uncharacterized protein LOC111358639 [Spodoptera litura]